MRYRVVKEFTDLKDHGYKYAMGDVFPRSGYIVSQSRIDELVGTNNRRGCAVIEPIQEAEEIPASAPVLTQETETFKDKGKRKKNAVRDLS